MDKGQTEDWQGAYRQLERRCELVEQRATVRLSVSIAGAVVLGAAGVGLGRWLGQRAKKKDCACKAKLVPEAAKVPGRDSENPDEPGVQPGVQPGGQPDMPPYP